ncbi:MAG: phosphate signaling complex protein PhoU [Clostridiales bacterium]|jgi:phosphate transport system protein|nr:phosphate signaling complex protein PhoU [Clostridiales bacterium]
MLRNKFQMELDALNLELVELGVVVSNIICDSVQALEEHNLELCNGVIDIAHQTRTKIDEIEDKALKIMLMQQPVACDLRTITTALKIVTDLDRISKQAREICHIVLDLGENEHLFDIKILHTMGTLATAMVNDCVQSFVKMDLQLAEKVINQDDSMDRYFSSLKEQMLEKIKSKSENADSVLYFMMIGKYLEKIGDFAESIAQWVKYSKLGVRRGKVLKG